MAKAIISTCVLGLAAFTNAAGPAPTPMKPNELTSSNGPSTYASGGAGCWSFDYNYLGCADGTLKCSSKTLSRYSPEASPGYLIAPGGPMEVRLWGPYQGADYDLYIEQWIDGKWKVVQQSAGSSGWKESVKVNTTPNAYYRFRAFHRSGSGYYALSWKV